MKIAVARTLDTVERVYNLIEKIASMKMLYLWYMREMGKPPLVFDVLLMFIHIKNIKEREVKNYE